MTDGRALGEPQETPDHASRTRRAVLGDGCYRRGRPRHTAARDGLVAAAPAAGRALARRFRNRGEPFDDLVQVGTIGLIKASTASTPTAASSSRRTRPRRSSARSSGTSATRAGRSGCRAGSRSCGCRSARPPPSSPRSWAAPPRSPSSPARLGCHRRGDHRGPRVRATPTPRCPLDAAGLRATTARGQMLDVIGGDDEALEHVEIPRVDQAAARPARPAREADPDCCASSAA